VTLTSLICILGPADGGSKFLNSQKLTRSCKENWKLFPEWSPHAGAAITRAFSDHSWRIV